MDYTVQWGGPYSGEGRQQQLQRKGGQAGGCEEEVPQEAKHQPVGANERRTGGMRQRGQENGRRRHCVKMQHSNQPVQTKDEG